MIYKFNYIDKESLVIVLYLVKIKDPSLTCQNRYGRNDYECD